MKLVRTALLLLIAAVSLSSQAVAASDEALIRAQYERFDRLIMARDVDGLMRLMSKDATFRVGTQTRNLEQWRQAFSGQVGALVQTRTRVDSVAINGQTAEVKTWSEQQYQNLRIEGMENTNFIVRSGSVDTWTKTADGWRLTSSQQKEIELEPII